MGKDESLEDRVQRRLREAAKNILQGIPQILMGMKDYLEGVNQWSDERVFSERFFVEMNGIDAIVRLSEAGERCKDFNHAAVLYDWARKKFDEFDAEFLINLFALTNDNESIVTLLMDWFLYLRIENEIHQRMKSRKVGMKYFAWVNRGSLRKNPQKLLDDLLDQTRKQILYAKQKVPLSTEIKEILKALSPNWRKTSLKPKRIPQIELDKEEFRGDASLKYEDWFSQHMKELKKQSNLENVEETLGLCRQCYSSLKDKRPLKNPAWDDFAPRALYVMILFLLPSLPMLTGKAENIPFKIRDDLKTRLRKLFRQKDWESLSEETQWGIPKIELIKAQRQSDSQLVDDVLRDLLYKNAFKDEIDKIIAENYGKSDQEIAGIIFGRTGGSITKQAVRKRRIKHVESVIKAPLEIRIKIMEDQERDEEKRIDVEDE